MTYYSTCNLTDNSVKTRHAIYVQRNNEARLRKHCCRRKAVSSTYLCVWGGGGARARGQVPLPARGVAMLIQRATCMRHSQLSFVASPASPYFSTLSHKGNDFRNSLLNIKCLFWFSVQILSKTFVILRRIQRGIVINVKTTSRKVPAILVTL